MENIQGLWVHITNVCWVSGAQRGPHQIKSHETSQSCPCDAPDLKPLAASLSGSGQFSDVNLRIPTLAPARTPNCFSLP